MSLPWSPYRLHTEVEPPIEDLPGHNLKPNPDRITTATQLREELRRLHQWAGEPSYRTLAERCGGSPSHTTFHKLLNVTDELPKAELVAVFVEALGLAVDREAWINAWRRAAARARTATEGTR